MLERVGGPACDIPESRACAVAAGAGRPHGRRHPASRCARCSEPGRRTSAALSNCTGIRPPPPRCATRSGGVTTRPYSLVPSVDEKSQIRARCSSQRQSLDRMELGRRWTFTHRRGNAYVESARYPEAAVAYHEAFMIELATNCGFREVTVGPSGGAQSELIARKPGAASRLHPGRPADEERPGRVDAP
jgi:hypothetical protein